MNAMQHGMYADFVSDPRVSILFMAYFAWTLMAYALKKFVLEEKNFGFKSAFIRAPFIGLMIYTCINIALMSLEPSWSMQLAFTDIVFGASMFSFITLITVIFKSYFD
jgi:uncharacterized membrane protein